MTENKLSVIIPSRVDQYLQKTIDDLLEKAEGDIEIIVILDGVWPDPIIKDDKRVILLHQGMVHDNFGMRRAINDGIRISSGEYIMKCDEHTMWNKGFDTKLKADCKDDWVVIPRRKRLDAEKWEIINDGRPDIDYMKLDFPYAKPLDKTQGLHGSEDRQRHYDRSGILVDDVMTMQGSAYFMKRSYWDKLFPNGLDDINYGPFTQEAQELSNTVWLSGGRVVVNKKTFYAHLHKGRKHGKGYGFSTAQYKKHAELNERGRLYCIDFWVNNKWDKRVHDFEWLINKFWPIQGWTDNWKQDIIEGRKTDYSSLRYRDDYWLSGLRENDE